MWKFLGVIVFELQEEHRASASTAEDNESHFTEDLDDDLRDGSYSLCCIALSSSQCSCPFFFNCIF